MSHSRLNFRIDAEAAGSRARAATFKTLHNEVLTPLFMPVGTQASVKAQPPEALAASGSQILLANTYHLLLRPGVEVFRSVGGIHKFMTWDRSVLTDSGGYQIFSLPHSRSITEEGAVFQSYIDGRTILLSPKVSIETQMAIGSDIMMVLDQCVPSTADRETVRAALDLTHRWAALSLEARGDSPQSMFGIVQGALFPDLRRESVDHLSGLPFDGLAIGGLAVGEAKAEREDMCELTAALMPRDKPRYLMGVGTPLDILEAVHRGVDMFDCIIPTQLAQRGGVFTSRGYVQLRRGVHKFADIPLDPKCACPTCARYSRAYLHHLTKSSEPLGWQLLGLHNIHFYHQLMRDIRASILDGTFMSLYAERREFLDEHDLDNGVAKVKVRPAPPMKRGAYEVHVAAGGFGSIRHVESGETMHAHTSPIEEARTLYVEQAQLRERVRLSGNANPDEAAPLVIWDVGLGAAANALAAIHCYQEEAEGGAVRGLRMVSFENDLDALRLACQNIRHFPYLRHGGPGGLLERGAWHSKKFPRLHWNLVGGDFRESMQSAAHPPDLIFYDPFSSRTNGFAWTLESFRRLFAACEDRDVEVFTYTASTAARAAMLAAGFYVARGRATDVKSESTIAFTPAALKQGTAARHALLGAGWLGRWKRSHARLPSDVPESESEAFERSITGHPQFAN
ncbi:MAG: tRNA guanosine(34) transglycosylase Tgt [Vicinamibacteria bacterium]|nr:tRNA guanosine(34) transglycosylase Tgt [Vicinamibacteria bacterium]